LKWNDIPLKTKLVALFLILSIVPLSIVGIVSYNNGKDSLEAEAINRLTVAGALKENRINGYFAEREGDALVLAEMADYNTGAAIDKLNAVAQIKSNQIEQYFFERQGDADVFASLPFIEEAIAELDNESKNAKVMGYTGKRLLDYAPYKRAFDKYHGFVQDYMDTYGYYDVFLLSPNSGRVLLSAALEDDFGTELRSENHHFAKAWQEMKESEQGVMTDIESYSISNGDAAMFIVQPSYKDGEYIGSIGLQISLDQINSVMQERAGLGESGETYLVSTDDELMRSDSRFSTESTILQQRISSQGVTSCNSEFQDSIYPDYRGVPVMGVYKTLDVEGLSWCLLAEIDELEALTPQTSSGDYFTKYTEVYGYYDLFLINPDGHIFYTVTREADYNTNCITGTYKDSNLCRLFRSVSNSGEVELSDIEAYAPSNGAPAGFIAAPVIGHDGELEVVVALQIATDQIDAIVQQAEGMGETGESYLIGNDMMFRSNSRLTTTDTILVTEVNTKGPQEAFKSKSDFIGIYGDYTTKAEADAQGGREFSEELGGVPVLGVNTYLPHVDWVLVNEIDEAEAFAPAADLRSKVQMIGGLAALIVAGLAFVVALSIIKPVNRIGEEAKELAATGDLSIRATVSGKDEIGQMAVALNEMLDDVAGPVQELGAIAEKIADGDLTEAVEIEAKGDIDRLAGSFKTMVDGLKDVLLQVSDSANFMAASSQEMSSAAEEVNATAEEVAAAVQQISQGTQDQANKVEIVSQNANASAASASKARETAEEGGKSADGAMAKMDSMDKSVGVTASAISGLGERSLEIGQIVDVITSIAEQTNLLALNAAIEAARAGEHGRGFAVVAEEVRKLAEESGQAAEKISEIIKEIQTETDKSVSSMEGVTTEVKEGTEVVTKAGGALKEIVGTVNKLAEDMQASVKAIDDIAAVTNETASSSEEVSASTEELTASMEEVSSSAAQLADLAGNLQNLVGRFKLQEGGAKKKSQNKPAAQKEAAYEQEPDVEAKIQRKVTKIRGKKQGQKTHAETEELEETPTVIAPSIAGNGGD